MKPEDLFSTREELRRIANVLSVYAGCPFAGDTIPGAILETLLAHIRGGKRMGTYDFIDVIKPETKCGWQVKSTMSTTPVTWKRAKIRDRDKLIAASDGSEEGVEALGKAIIDFCNEHVIESFNDYGLEQIGYARLILHKDGRVSYFERPLCTKDNPILFNHADFSWKWSTAKKTKGKEQLSALHGTHIPTKQKWWAWHGRGENQLHFSGEQNWWPEIIRKNSEIPSLEDSATETPLLVGKVAPQNHDINVAGSKVESDHLITFRLPDSKMGLDAFVELLEKASNPS